MRHFKIVILAGMLLALTACTSQPIYSPATRADGPGYSETKLTDTRYRVSFVGQASTSSNKVKNLALLRAAELTLLNEYEWFQIVDRETIGRSRNTEPRISIGVATGCHPFGCRVIGSRWYTGVRLDSERYVDRYQTSMEIILGKGEPDDPTKVYDARELENNLRRSLVLN